MKKLAIITTHPIQYYAPIFRMLAQRQKINVHVFYTWSQAASKKMDPGFGKEVSWDIPLLNGYRSEFVKNIAVQPGSHHFKGIVNPGLIPAVSAWQPDAVLVFGWSYDSHLKVLRHFKNRVPVLFRGDSTLLDERAGIKSLLRSLFLTWAYRNVDYALYPGINTKAYFKKYGLKNASLVFAPHAVENERFASGRPEEVAFLRASLKLAEEDILILFAGKLEPKKDPFLLLNAFLKLERPNCRLLFVGNGILEAALKKKAGANPRVNFMDFQNQSRMPVIYQACDLFCLPSAGPGETWGLAVNEAMACAKAVLVSDKVGCAADLVAPGRNGGIFESGSESGLLEQLQKLTGSKSTLVQQGKHSAVKINAYRFEQVAAAIENIVLK